MRVKARSKIIDGLFKPRLFVVALMLCATLLWSGALSGCGVRKVPLPAEDVAKPRYPPR